MKFLDEALEAIDNGDTDCLASLLKQHPGLIECHSKKEQPLLFTCLDWPGGKPKAHESVRVLLMHGADPNQRLRGEEGETPLHWAASLVNDSKSIPILVEAGADVNVSGAVTKNGTPLHNATHFGMVEAARGLMACGAWTDCTALAAGTGQLAKLKSFRNDDGTFLAQANARGPNDSCSGNLEPEEVQEALDHALNCAVFCEQYHCADWLLEVGAGLNEIGEGCDSTLLHQVARRGSLSMAHFLLSRGADPTILATVRPAQPFHYAVANANPEIMNFLIDNGSKLKDTEAAYCGRLDRVANLELDMEKAKELLIQTIGTQTVLGRSIPEQMAEARRAVARFLLQRFPDLKDVAELRGNQALLEVL